jgi:hypothetical protein
MTFGKQLLLRLYTLQFLSIATHTSPLRRRLIRRKDSKLIQIRNNKKCHVAPSTQPVCVLESFRTLCNTMG